MVTDVEDGSPADERGLQPGDIIEQVGQTPVKDEATFTRLMNAQKRAGRPAVLFVTRNGNGQYVTFRLDK